MKKIIFLFCLTIFAFAGLYPQSTSEFKMVPGKMASPSKNKQASINYNRGIDFLKNNELESAEKCFIKALELDPAFVDAMDHLGVVYRRQNRIDDAIQMYQKSISIKPDNYVPYNNLALVYMLLGKYEDARLTYLKVIDFDKENPEPYYGIGQLYYKAGMFNDSIEYMQVALSKYYQQKSIYMYDAAVNLAYAFYNIEDYEESLKYLKFAYQYYKDDKKIEEMISSLEALIKEKKE